MRREGEEGSEAGSEVSLTTATRLLRPLDTCRQKQLQSAFQVQKTRKSDISVVNFLLFTKRIHVFPLLKCRSPAAGAPLPSHRAGGSDEVTFRERCSCGERGAGRRVPATPAPASTANSGRTARSEKCEVRCRCRHPSHPSHTPSIFSPIPSPPSSES